MQPLSGTPMPSVDQLWARFKNPTTEIRSNKRKVLYQGWLAREGARSGSPVKRWVFLLSDLLIVTKNLGKCAKPTGHSGPAVPLPNSQLQMKQVIPLRGAQLDERMQAMREFSARSAKKMRNSFILRSSLAQVYKFGTDSPDSTQIWLTQLKEVISSLWASSEAGADDDTGAHHELHLGTLWSSARAGDALALREALDARQDLDVNAVDDDGRTPLIYACMFDEPEIARVLIANDADTAIPERGTDRSPLDFAVEAGSVGCIELLAGAGVDINFPDREGVTPLHRALQAGPGPRAAVGLDALLRLGAKVDYPDQNDSQTALHVAAMLGDVDCVELLLGAGAQPNLRDAQKRTPLHLAKNEEIGILLCRKGARVGLEALDTSPAGARFDSARLKEARAQYARLEAPPNVGLRQAAQKDHWTPDDHSRTCMLCAVGFTATRRRHHCRYCGVLCCNDCSRKRLVVGPSKEGPQRACDGCFNMYCKQAADKPANPGTLSVVGGSMVLSSVGPQSEDYPASPSSGAASSAASPKSPSRTAASAAAAPASRGASSATAAQLQQTKQQAVKNVEKAAVLEDKSAAMANQAQDFLAMSEQLAAMYEKKNGKKKK